MQRILSVFNGFKYLAPVVLLLVLSLAGCNNNAESKSAELAAPPVVSGVAVVNVEAVYEKSVVAKAGMDYLNVLNTKMQEDYLVLQKEMLEKKDDNEFQATAHQKLAAMQEDMEKQQNRVAVVVSEQFETVIEDFRKELNLDAVLHKQTVLAMRPELDITDKVQERLDAKSIDFATAQPKKAPVTAAPAISADGAAAPTAPADGTAAPAAPTDAPAAPADGTAAPAAPATK